MKVLDRLGTTAKTAILVPIMALCGWSVGAPIGDIGAKVAAWNFGFDVESHIGTITVAGGVLGALAGCVWGWLRARRRGPEPETLFGSA